MIHAHMPGQACNAGCRRTANDPPLPAPAQRKPAECLTADVVQNGRRFVLCLVDHLYDRCGVAIFNEVSGAGASLHDVYQDVGTWNIYGGRDTEGGEDGPPEATPSLLAVECRLPDDVDPSEVMNELLRQIGTEWSDSWEPWP